MKQTIKRTIIAGAALALLVSPAAVMAKDGLSGGDDTVAHAETESPEPSPSQSPRVRQLEAQLKNELEQQRQGKPDTDKGKPADLLGKLDDAKRKACENHAATINRLETVIDKRRTNALDNINKITAAVEAFYVKKNLSVANYDELVAKVDAAKNVAEQAVQQQQQIPTLDCSGDHPHADAQDFKDKRSLSTAALKAYRDAVKALVQAVKTAVGDTHSPSPSPSPTSSPETEGGNV